MFRKVISFVVLLPFALLLVPVSAIHATSIQVCGQWTVQQAPSSTSHTLYSVTAISSTDAWAVGKTTIHWDGSSWQIVPIPVAATLYGVSAVSSNDVWAVGNSINQYNYEQTLALHWDGSSWQSIPTRTPEPSTSNFQAVFALSTSDVWAVGYEIGSNGNIVDTTEHWNGTEWQIVDTPPQPTGDHKLMGVIALSSTAVWASGTETLHWDGTVWSQVPNSRQAQALEAFSDTNIWGVGTYFNFPKRHDDTMTEHWNGSTWKVVVSPNGGTHNALLGVAAKSPTDMWAVGWQSSRKAESHALIEHWTGWNSGKWAIVNSSVLSSKDTLASVASVPGTSQYLAVGSTKGHMLIESYC